MKTVKACEHVRPRDQVRCRHPRTFLVGIGTRKFDRQWCCSQHLAATILAMADGERQLNPAGQPVVVQWYPRGEVS